MNYNEILKLPEGIHIVTVNTERCMVVRLQEGYTRQDDAHPALQREGASSG